MLAADDPGMHSSQNEQDSHYYGLAAKVPVLDPSDSQEAYEMTQQAFKLSEEFDVPVIVRSTVRISHTKSPVKRFESTSDSTSKGYERDQSKWVMMPVYARSRRVDQLARIDALTDFARKSSLNKVEVNDTNIGVICTGATYQHVREALPNASILKLGISWPIPCDLVQNFASEVDRLYVIEEASEYLRTQIKACGVEVASTVNPLPQDGELNPQIIRSAFNIDNDKAPLISNKINTDNLAPRPPALCPGCPHRVVFKELSRMKAIVTGDIGCYSLGALAPLSAIDSVVDMGASVSMAHGMELALKDCEHKPIVGIIGDSTFAHSGLESLASTAYNNGGGTICILDNRTTAMTGRQGNPFNGEALCTQSRIGARELDMEELSRALGAQDVVTVDPDDVSAVRLALKEATSNPDKLSVIIFKSPCVLLNKERNEPYFITSCTGCGVCLSLGCPAIGKEEDTGLSYIDPTMCIGCGQCAQYCKFDAIVR